MAPSSLYSMLCHLPSVAILSKKSVYDLRKKQEVCSFGAREKMHCKMKKQTLELSQDQIISALLLMQERGFDRSNLLKMALEAMMRAERYIHNEEASDLGNGYRL